MSKFTAALIHAELESNPHNNDGAALALYFDRTPTAQEVTAAAHTQWGKHVVGLDPNDEAEFEVYATPMSERAKLVRVLVFNIG